MTLRGKITSTFLAAIVLANTACGRETIHGGSSPPTTVVPPSARKQSWVERGIGLLRANRCDDLRAFLQSIPKSEVSEEWYELRALGEGTCWSRSHLESDKHAAFSTIEEGINRYPQSALLIADKGALLEMFGDAVGAQSFYERAAQVATENLRRNPQSRNDRYVLRRLGKQLPPLSATPLDTTGTTSSVDLTDARPAWQQRAWQLLAADNCKAAVDYLNANPRPESVWYAMYSQADLLCWQEGLGDHFKQHALAILDIGLQLRPSSPRLLKSKAEYYQLVGDGVSAAHFRELARDRAKTAMSTPNDPAKAEAEEVLNELRLKDNSKQ